MSKFPRELLIPLREAFDVGDVGSIVTAGCDDDGVVVLQGPIVSGRAQACRRTTYPLVPCRASSVRARGDQLFGDEAPARSTSLDVLDARVVECIGILVVGVHSVP